MTLLSTIVLASSALAIKCNSNNDHSHDLESAFFYPNSSNYNPENAIDLAHKKDPETENSESQNDEKCGKPQPGQNFALFYLFCYRQSFPIQDVMALYFGIGLKIQRNFEHIYEDGMSVVFQSTPKLVNRAAKNYGAYTMKTFVFPKLYAFGKALVNTLWKHYTSMWKSELEQANNRFKGMSFDEKSKLWMQLTEYLPNQYTLLVQERKQSGRIEAYKEAGVYRVYGRYAVHYRAQAVEYDAARYFQEDEDEETRFGDSDRQFLPRLSLPPAILFPWPWSNELDKTRSSIEMMKEYVDVFQRSLNTSHPENVTSDMDSISQDTELAHQYLRYVHDMSPELSDSEAIRHLDISESADECEFGGDGNSDRFRCLHEHLRSFHYATGIPDLTLYEVTNVPEARFPNLTEFMAVTCSKNESLSQEFDIEILEISASESKDEDGDCMNNCTRARRHHILHPLHLSSLYGASLQFYTYPVFHSYQESEWRRSGVTIYTPHLMEYALCQHLYQCENASRVPRILVLEKIIQDAADHELKGLSKGIQASSTVWFSQEDRNSDEFADAVLGFGSEFLGNLTKERLDKSPGEMLYRRMEEPHSILHLDAYYTYSSRVHESIPDAAPLKALQEDDMLQFVDLIRSIMHQLSSGINAYAQRRKENSLYRLLSNSTKHREWYDTHKALTEIAISSEDQADGFILYETNPLHVLYRDLRMPHPFHLIVRLLIRLHESQLLLPEESRRIISCATLEEMNLTFHRCQPP
uniref:Uncharacterized protein AlNc14C128G6867 n=1 Tax=Albugo laibachii Nc14 TaxID=890382 RepID=F0WK13_9STRA|nr:conserved hypothetical protein [Albugo laibachii Nc14]|eukprot:CCA21615.1 conserved hypothetical protein [Albugo laibachii Nc14]